VTYAEEGTLDQGLVRCVFGRFGRDFGQFSAGWYSRFHTALKPTPEEMAAQTKHRYLELARQTMP
jgi:hypothetical protein